MSRPWQWVRRVWAEERFLPLGFRYHAPAAVSADGRPIAR
jgi:hypothetical protein